jgi:hypothetical protein
VQATFARLAARPPGHKQQEHLAYLGIRKVAAVWGSWLDRHEVTGYEISQNPEGSMEISAHHHYIGSIIHSLVRVEPATFHIQHK